MYKHNIILLSYNKDVICVLDKNSLPVCKTIASGTRRNIGNDLPSHEPYLPSIENAFFYNCSSTQCEPLRITSIIQVASPEDNFKMCYSQKERYTCTTLKYYHFKDIDKLLFLSNNIKDKSFYLIDCLLYRDGGRVCNKKDDVDSHTKLVDTGNVARPSEASVLSQDEFICEEDRNKNIKCDLNHYVPYVDGLKPKQAIKTDKEILLKTGNSFVVLKLNCIDDWCGFRGNVKTKRKSRRFDSVGKVYRCYYANRQQVCKQIRGSHKNVYNARDWLSSK